MKTNDLKFACWLFAGFFLFLTADIGAQSIQVYQYAHFAGKSLSFSPGQYDGAALKTLDYKAGSVKIPSGMMVSLFAANGYSGNSLVRFEDTHDLGMGGGQVNVRSLKVENVAEAMIQAALEGPERKQLKICGHEFNIKPATIRRDPTDNTINGRIIVEGEINHHLSLRPDDDFFYKIVVDPSQDATIKDLRYKIEEGGFTTLFKPILGTIAGLIPYIEVSEDDLEEVLRTVGRYVDGDWQPVAVSIATAVAVKAGQARPNFQQSKK